MMRDPGAARITHGSLLVRNVLWNLVGQGSPLVVAVFAIPLLIHHLGNERFGLLTVAWVVIGYFSVFDFGLGRALTQAVAEKLGSRRDSEVPTVVWSALLVMFALGVIGLTLVGVVIPLLVPWTLKVPAVLRGEALQTLRVLAISIPIVVTTAGLRGVLEAHQRFDLLNALRIPLGIFTYLGPLAVLPFSRSLPVLVAVLLGGRVLAWLAHFLMCLRVVSALRRRPRLEKDVMGRLLRLGSWMTVSNLMAPLMVSVDRFLVGAVVSVTAVAYYSTPYEVVTKLWQIPFSVASVLFPVFATIVTHDQAAATELFARGVKYTFALLFPAVLLIVSFADQGLSIWVDPEFARHSSQVLQLLAVGVLISSLALIPLSLLQGSGRPDLTARLHLAELPFYLLLLWVLLHAMGVVGVAVAWLARVGVDAIILFLMSQRLAPVCRRTMLHGAIFFFPSMSLLVIVGFLPDWLRWVLTPPALVGFLAATWFLLLSPQERAHGINGLKPALFFR